MHTIQMIVSKTVNSKREKIGAIPVVVPTLEEVAEAIAAAKEVEAVEGAELPEYDTNEANWIMSAVRAAAFATIRNKLEPGTINVKNDETLPTTFAELVKPSERTGSGEALAAIREFVAMFKDYMEAKGLTQKTTAFVVELFKTSKALNLQPAEMRAKLLPHFEGFANWLEETGAEITDTQSNYYERVIAACTEEEEEELFSDL